MTPLESVKAKIIKACPEVMELKFGCEVIVEGIREDNPGYEYDIVVHGRVKDGRINLGYFGEVPIEKLQILGSKIGIAEVLRALRNKNIGNFGGEFVRIVLGDWKMMDFDWDLFHDSLEWHAEHKPEVVEWLNTILI